MPTSSNVILIIAGLLSSMIISGMGIPAIVRITKQYNMYDKPGDRSSHSVIVPSLGGIAIFMGFSLSFLLFSNGYFKEVLQYIVASLLIIFSLGVNDDLTGISPIKKIVGQVIAALIVVVLGNLRITYVYGFLGFYEINYVASVIISVFSIMVIANAFNLIDGIDGLASGISVLVAITFGICFFLSGYYHYTILCACFLGSVLVFYWFNVFGKINKIFMGDTGSMVLGLIVSIMVIAFNEMNINNTVKNSINSASVVASGILIIPFFDMIRIILLRALRGRAPWVPDKNHVHHRLLSLGLSHFKATSWILAVNVVIILITFILQYYNVEIHLFLLILLSLGALFSLIPFYLVRIRKISKELKKSKPVSQVLFSLFLVKKK